MSKTYKYNKDLGMTERGKNRYGTKENSCDCPVCFGGGRHGMFNCVACDGTGKIYNIKTKNCPSCNGTGEVAGKKCEDCSGTGYEMSNAKENS